ncbi:MAG: signal recognition particle receptor subunit alpha, partial [Actinomycetota bacterium]
MFGVGVVVVGRRRSSPAETADAVQTTVETVGTTSVRERLAKARASMSGAIATALTRSSITDETGDELEESLLRADLGVATTTRVLQPLRGLVASKKITEPSQLMAILKDEMRGQLDKGPRELNFDGSLQAPNIWLVVGVNGAGKTTTIGKIGAQQRKLGRSVLMAAGDTVR